jgi:predicted metalloprotease with PDZ domain
MSQTANSFLLGAPDLRVVEREVMGGPVRVALHGKFEFEDAAFADAIARIAEAQRRFWGDRDAAFFVPMIALAPMASGYSSIGTGRGDAFALWATGNIKLDGLTRLLAHEHMHSWIDDQVGRRGVDEEGLEYWFSEGFTDFYALRTLLGAGLFTPEDHAREMNEALLRLASSPARTAPNARIKEAFWKDEDVRQLPYDRGHFFAALLDHRLREASGGRADLDDVLLAQRAHARARPATDRTSSGRLLPVFAKQVAGLDIQPLIDRHMRDGEPFELPADLYGDCARVETAIRPDFHRGFDIDATQKNNRVITGVRKDGPAYAAGMRDGMTLVKRGPGGVNDPAVEIAYHVLDGGTERVIRYLPAGRERLQVQRVVLAEPMTPERRTACARRMSGS